MPQLFEGSLQRASIFVSDCMHDFLDREAASGHKLCGSRNSNRPPPFNEAATGVLTEDRREVVELYTSQVGRLPHGQPERIIGGDPGSQSKQRRMPIQHRIPFSGFARMICSGIPSELHYSPPHPNIVLVIFRRCVSAGSYRSNLIEDYNVVY